MIIKLAPPLIATLCISTLFLAGCRSGDEPSSPANVEGTTQVASTSSKPVEFIVINAIGDHGCRQRMKNEIEKLALLTLSGGSLLTIVDAPAMSLVVSLKIPQGSSDIRIRNTEFNREYLKVQEYFERGFDGDSNDNLNVVVFPETIASLRRSGLPTRVVLCGSPVYRSETVKAFNMTDGRYPSHLLIGHPHSPFSDSPKLQDGAEVAWYTRDGNWGTSMKHRRDVRTFYQVWINRLSARLVRVTSDPSLAFAFEEPFLPDPPSLPDDAPAMHESNGPVELTEPANRPKPKRIELVPAQISFRTAGTIAHQFEIAGTSLDELSALRIRLALVIDGSGSQQRNMQDIASIAEKVASELSGLVRSFDIAVHVRRDDSAERLGFTRIPKSIGNSTGSTHSITRFFQTTKASGGDEPFVTMVRAGIRELESQAPVDREFFMLMGDHADGDEDHPVSAGQHELQRWLARDQSRRVLMVFTGQSEHQRSIFSDISVSPRGSAVDGTSDVISEIVSLCRVGLSSDASSQTGESLKTR
ncbi:MAG: hypothetical protein CMM00_05365 [Rhodopirellula sp.]|uniref:Secreted protein n=2 Tax=Pirellulaceae TaxID=2691357 RepID=M5S4F3_9BACT|nr:secreted protein [Rhodopirellula europaea SH398]MAP08262.1 hypothetical protein [Rhodopirellula sp.]